MPLPHPAADGCVRRQLLVNRNTQCYQSVGTVVDQNGTSLSGTGSLIAAGNAAHPRIPRYGRIGYDRERLGITGSVQWQLSEATRVTYDSLYAQLDQTRSEDFLETISGARETLAAGFRATDLVTGTINNNRTLATATFNDVDVRVENRIDILSTEFFQNSIDLQHEFSDTLRFSGLVGLSRAIGRNPQQTTVTFDRYDVDGYSYDFTDQNEPGMNYGFDVTNPANFNFSSSSTLGEASLIRLRPNKTVNSYENYEGKLEWDINDSLSIAGGASTKTFGFSVAEFRRLTPTGGSNETVPASVTALLAARGIGIGQYSKVIDLSGSINPPAGTPTRWVIPDLKKLNALIGFDCNCINEYGDFRLSAFAAENRSVSETSDGVWVQAGVDTEVLGRSLRGNLGVRYVKTTVDATGILSGSRITVTNEYDDTLPSLNLAYEPVDDFLIRFAASKVMARPTLNQLTPGGSLSQASGEITLTVGNPILKPIRSTNYDLSFEWYPYQDALFSVALFSKELSSYVQTTRERRPFSTTGLPTSVLPAGFGTDPDVIVVGAANTPGGDVTGYELTLQSPFFFLDGTPFEGFGGLLNYTSVDGTIQYIVNPTAGTTTDQPIIGQSPKSLSATIYFERGPFEARVSGTYRDEYLTRVPTLYGNDVDGKNSSFNLDVSASFDVNDHITLSFEGLNLTDQYDERWTNSVRKHMLNYEHSGREFVVGIRFKH